MNRSERWWTVCVVAAVSGCASLLGVGAGKGGSARPAGDDGAAGPARAVADDRPALWVYRHPGRGDEAGSSTSGPVGGAVGGVASALAHLMLPSTLEAGVVDRPVMDDGAVLQVGLNLSAYRREHGGEFADDSLNRALHELGLANAREVVVSFRPGADRLRPLTADVLVAYRSRPPGQYTRVELSMPGPRVAEVGGEVSESWLRPRMSEWADACVAFHRASLGEEDRLAFDRALRQWRLDHGEAQRRVLATLRGPVVLTASGGAPCVLVGVRSEDEGRSLGVPLEEVLESIGCTVDPGASPGDCVMAPTGLEGTVLARLAVRVGRWRDSWWIGVSREADRQALTDLMP